MITEAINTLRRRKTGGNMYFETELNSASKLGSMGEDDLIKLLKEAADKTNTDPESFYIYPCYIGLGKVYLLIRSSLLDIGKTSEFANYCGLSMDNFEFSEISREQYSALSEGIGLDYYLEGCAEYPKSFWDLDTEYMVVPSEEFELFMPNRAEHPKALIKELIFIAKNKKSFFTPINYYIVSSDKRRQSAIREALLQSLKMHSWIHSLYYKTISLETKGGKYHPAMAELDYFYYGERDYPIVISINGDKIQPQKDETLNSFVETIIKYKDVNTTIIESNFFDETMMKEIEKRDSSIPFVLIKDSGKVRIPDTLPNNVFRSNEDYFNYLKSKKDPRVFPCFDV